VRILIAAWRSDLFGGMETYTRDLALGLERRGHSVAVVNDGVHRTGRPMSSEGVRVCRDWDEVGFAPDVIHGQSAVDTVAALSRFPVVPAVFQCHSAGPLSAPPRHPRIYRYLGMGPTFTQRLAIEFGFPEYATEVVANSVDLSRFRIARRPPDKPTKVLFYNSYHWPGSPTLEAIRVAVSRCGLELDCIGRPFGNVIERPEDVLPGYDIVFACGRSAIEAIASGCAVIVLSMTSCGELVRPSNFDRLRRANFAIPFNSLPPSANRIEAEIAAYAAADCAAVTFSLRREADVVRAIAQVEEIYGRVIDEHRTVVMDEGAEQRAVARYLRSITELVGLIDHARSAGFVPMNRSGATISTSIQISDAGARTRPAMASRTFL
jgi:hypothetical protein